jgi:hypothetical protein
MCLARNHLGVDGVRLLSQAVSGMTSLRTLDLTANGLTAEAIANLRDAFSVRKHRSGFLSPRLQLALYLSE